MRNITIGQVSLKKVISKTTESNVIDIRYAYLFHPLYGVTSTIANSYNQYLAHNFLFLMWYFF